MDLRLDGQLVRAKHTEDLEDFSLEAYSLEAAPTRDAGRASCSSPSIPAARAPRDWLDDVSRPFRAGSTSPPSRRRKRIEYDVAANWKFIAENYSECYHCPGLHPQLNRLTPYDLGGDFETRGPWQGGYMELVGGAETMAVDGGHRAGRPAMRRHDRARRAADLLRPHSGRSTFISTHPDYILVHRLEPLAVGPDARRVRLAVRAGDAWLLRGFDASDAYEFWDTTNRQDWHVCELQQRGTRSRSWTAGRYSNQEPSVHAFDLMVVDRYAGDGISSRRTVRERYDVPLPKDGDGERRWPAPVAHDRAGARAKAASQG